MNYANLILKILMAIREDFKTLSWHNGKGLTD